MQKLTNKWLSVLIGTEILVFLMVVIPILTPQRSVAVTQFFYLTLKYVLGFPLILLRNISPLLLKNHQQAISALSVAVISNLILTGAIVCIWNIAKRILSSRKIEIMIS